MARGLITRGNNLTKDTLLKIAAGGIFVIAAAISPYFLHAIVKSYFKDKTLKNAQARARKLRELERKNLIKFQEDKNGMIRMELTHQGRHVVHTYNLEEMKLQKPKKWDGQWRVLIYDIPRSQKKASNAFREKIRQLGLFPLQKSVWVSPYECFSEIEFLTIVFNINLKECVLYFRTNEIPKLEELKKFFS